MDEFCLFLHTPTYKGKESYWCTNVSPLMVGINFVCFTLFTAIPVKSLISCIIEQPVQTSRPGCDGCVCGLIVEWTSFPLADDVIFLNRRRGIFSDTGMTSSLLAMEDKGKTISQCECGCSCMSVFFFFFFKETISSTLEWGNISRWKALKHAQSYTPGLPCLCPYPGPKSAGW